MEFHEKLYALRKSANLTQADLAEHLNVSRQAVSRWEMGTAKPEVDTLVQISNLFGVSLDELLKNQEPSPSPAEAPGPNPGWNRAQTPTPRFWDFVPKLWWVPAVLAAVFRLLPYGGMAAMILGLFRNPEDLGQVFTNMALIPIFAALSSASLLVLLGCFLWALIRWGKARR